MSDPSTKNSLISWPDTKAFGIPLTRERWLAYRLGEAIDRDNIDIKSSPALLVWAILENEISKWMREHGIQTGMRAGQTIMPEKGDVP